MMPIEVGEFNPKLFLLLGVVALVAGGWFWWGSAYQPARDKRDAAMQTNTTTQAQLEKVESELANLRKGDDKDAVDNDRWLALVQKSSLAIPRVEAPLSALQQIEEMARQAGLDAEAQLEPVEAAGSEDRSVPGLVTRTVTVSGVGTFSELAMFTRKVQDTAYTYKGKLYVRTRLMAVTGMVIDDASNAVTPSGDGANVEVPKGHVHFKVVIEFYAAAARNRSATAASPAATSNGSEAGSTSGSQAATGQPGTAGAATGSMTSGTGGTGAMTSGTGSASTGTGGVGTSSPTSGSSTTSPAVGM